ncbi:MAG: sterol desaturase family protein [Chlorobi bacterium]|nr:sterol desaturase family protein [Chlorobiota bacterium]
MEKYLNIISNSYKGYYNYIINEILHPGWHNYFYWLIAISLFFWLLEIAFPWRKKQSFIRQDFWLDAFYMFFNFFLFSLIIYNALSNVVVDFFNNEILKLTGFNLQSSNPLHKLPHWAILIMVFFVRDFIQFNVHRLLHYYPWLWQFHKVHHSVKEMGFAAHLRYHWMENIVYRTIEYIPLALLGVGLYDFFVVHIIALSIGHFNHSNFNFPLGPLKYFLNNPQMHIWHHAKTLPNKYGVNFGISLSLWDYLFKTNYIPANGRDIELGFEKDEYFPKGFLKQAIYH